MRVLGLIPARGGSKGVPGKNIRSVGGKPLIAWTIAAARKSKFLDRLILSSDDRDIIAVARRYGCEVPFVRPKNLAPLIRVEQGWVVTHGIAVVKPGRILFEMGGVGRKETERAFELAGHKLPVLTKFVARQTA